MASIYTQAGEEKVVDYIDGTDTTVLDATNSFIGWGSGAGVAAKADTVLFTEESEARVNPVISQPSADKNRWVGTITSSGTKTITNAGLLDASTGGSLIIHGDFGGIALVNGDKIEFTIELEQT